MKKYCRTCASASKTQDGRDACARFKILINPNEDFCSQHVTKGQTGTCELCRVHLPFDQFYIWVTADESKNYIVCKNCLANIGSCNTCKYQTQCGFAADHSAPQVIMKTVRQGMMQMQTQVKNPTLVVKHCQKCRCSDDADPHVQDVYCFRDENGANCSKWEMR